MSKGAFICPNTYISQIMKGKSTNYIDKFVNDEYLAFPVSTHDDMLDCRARILDPKLEATFPMFKETPKKEYNSHYGSGGHGWMG